MSDLLWQIPFVAMGLLLFVSAILVILTLWATYVLAPLLHWLTRGRL